MGYNDELRIAKFMVKQYPKKTTVLKYIVKDDFYVVFKTIPRNVEYRKSVFNIIKTMPNNMEFIAIYSKLDSFREIYKVLGVRKK